LIFLALLKVDITSLLLWEVIESASLGIGFPAEHKPVKDFNAYF
jgi:hypothetical protein